MRLFQTEADYHDIVVEWDVFIKSSRERAELKFPPLMCPGRMFVLPYGI